MEKLKGLMESCCTDTPLSTLLMLQMNNRKKMPVLRQEEYKPDGKEKKTRH